MLQYHYYNSKNIDNLNFVFIFSLIFTIVLLSGGFFTNTIAIIAVALFDLVNTLNIGFSWLFKRLFEDNFKDTYTYGYKRLSIIVSIISSVIIIGMLIFLIYESIINFYLASLKEPIWILIISIFGIIFRIASLYILKKEETRLKQIFIDYINHVFGWVVILIFAVFLVYYNISFLDNILAIAISFWIIFNLCKLLFNNIKVLVQRIPSNFDINKFKKDILAIPNVRRINEIHLWSIDGYEHVLTMKVAVNFTNIHDFRRIKKEVLNNCETNGIFNTTIEFVD